MKTKQIVRFKQGKKVDNLRRLFLTNRKEELIKEILDINDELHSGKRMDIEEAQRKEYTPYISKKDKAHIGCRLSLPLCLLGKTIRIKVVKGKQLQKEIGGKE